MCTEAVEVRALTRDHRQQSAPNRRTPLPRAPEGWRGTGHEKLGRLGVLLGVTVLAGALACGPKPVANLDVGGADSASEQATLDGSGAGWETMDWGPWNSGIGEGLPPDSTQAGLSAQAEEHLAAAELALATAGERLTAGQDDGYRESLDEALDSLRRAQELMSEDPAAFAFLRPAYESLIADLRMGLTTAGVATASALDASPDELAGAAEVYLSNGATYEMPVNPDDPLVAKYLALFQEGKRRQFIEEAFERSNRYRGMVLEEIRKAGLPEELWVVPVIESGYKVSAYSRAKAVGLWQFMPTTGRHYGLTINEWVDERRDPVKSTRAAMAYLKDLYLWFNSWDFALAAYNRGEGGIHRDIQRSRIADFMEMAELGVTHQETLNHVPQIHAAAIIAKHPEKYGFRLVDAPVEADTVVIDYLVDLEVVAECAGTTERELRELNPELRTWVTPVLSKDYPAYTLKLPKGSGDRYRTAVAQVEDKTPKRRLVYVVRRGDTLSGIARKFGVSVQNLREWNHLRSSRLRRGQRLVVLPKKGTTTATAKAGASGSAGKSAERAASSSSEAGSSVAEATIVTHTVRRGDTLYGIALQYDTSIEALRRLNGLSKSGKIYPGQKLKVETGS